MKVKQMKNQELKEEKQMIQHKMSESKLNNEKMKRLKEQGVTLVALVVTIIIMLILAGVALNIALGDNGLFKMSKNATEKYKEAQRNEEEDLSALTGKIEETMESMQELTAKELKTEAKKYYGSYVNYGIDLDGDGKYISDWKLFYVGGQEDGEANGRIYLIAADYVPTDNKTLQEAMKLAKMEPATKDGYGTLSAYWGARENVPSYQNLDKLDVNPINLFMHTGYNIQDKTTIDASKCVSTLLNTNNWAGFAKGNYGEAAIGGPTLEMWCKAWNQVLDEKDGFTKIYANGNNSIDTGYYVGNSSSQTETKFYYVNGKSELIDSEKNTLEENYKLFFPHMEKENITANNKVGNCESYWLASPSADYDACVNTVGSNGAVGRCGFYEDIRAGSTTIGMLEIRSKIAKKYRGVNR